MNNTIKTALAVTGICIVTAASATIVAPTTISKTADMDFGKIAPSRLTVVKHTAAAQFAVSGLPFVMYNISLPENTPLADSNSNTMEVSSFISYPAANGTLGADGTQTLKVAGMLDVPANQPAGAYRSANDVEVTINFN